MSVQASEVVAAIEQMSKVSMKGLEDALALVQRMETTRAAEIATAQDALGPAYAGTVVELARVTTAARTSELLIAIRDLADRLLGGSAPPVEAAAAPLRESLPPVREPAPAAAEPQALSRQRVFSPPPPKASSRDEMYGVPFPASRREEADDVVAQVRRALAQGHKTNPFESYRGKNQWCKKLFDMAYASLSSGASEAPEGDVGTQRTPAAETAPAPAAVPEREPTPAPAPTQPTRSSVTMSGPARGIRNRFGPPAPPVPSSGGSMPRDPSSGRRFGMGVVPQTIDPEGLEPSAPARESFYKRNKR